MPHAVHFFSKRLHWLLESITVSMDTWITEALWRYPNYINARNYFLWGNTALQLLQKVMSASFQSWDALQFCPSWYILYIYIFPFHFISHYPIMPWCSSPCAHPHHPTPPLNNIPTSPDVAHRNPWVGVRPQMSQYLLEIDMTFKSPIRGGGVRLPVSMADTSGWVHKKGPWLGEWPQLRLVYRQVLRENGAPCQDMVSEAGMLTGGGGWVRGLVRWTGGEALSIIPQRVLPFYCASPTCICNWDL